MAPLTVSPGSEGFGAGLTEADVLKFRDILRKHGPVDVPLPEAWARAIEMLSLTEMLLGSDADAHPALGFALPPS